VLGIDNVIFISILVDKLPPEKRDFARKLGLFMAMFMRLGLLLILLFAVTLGWLPAAGSGEPLSIVLPAVTKFPAVALSGLSLQQSTGLGAEFRGNLFSAQHNTRNVGRHVFTRDGSTFRSEDSSFVTSDDLLPERALNGDGHARRQLVTAVYAPLQAAGPTVLETVAVFLERCGSIEATARALFVHPNTVRYRLQRVAEVTGLSAGDPREAYTLRLALTLGRLLSPEG